MKRIARYMAVAVMVLLVLAACSRKGGESAAEEEKYGVSASDSLTILTSTNEIMTLLQAGDFQGAAGKLYTFNATDSSVTAAGEPVVEILRKRDMVFPVKSFDVKEVDFLDPIYNTVVYNVAFGEASSETGEAPITKMAFNVINKDGNYYVTIMDSPTVPAR